MEITRDVILDLLPLYLANEVSADTRALIDKYLETDPELANLAKLSPETLMLEDIPIPLTQEDKMKAYLEAKRFMFWRTVVLAVTISFTVLAFLSLAALVALRTFG